MQRHECSKHNYLCINDSLKFLFPCENQGITGLSPNLSYNELVSATIDQERLMKVIAEADEKKRKRMMLASSASGGSSSAPPKYHMVYTPSRGQLRRPQQQ
jgi:hypothetical protein